MKLLSQIKISLLWGLVFLSVMACAYLIFNGYSTLTYTFQGSREIVEHQHALHKALNGMYRAARERTLLLSQMNAVTDPFELDELRQKMRDQAGNFIAAREKFVELSRDSGGYADHFNRSLVELINQNEGAQNTVADLFVDGEPDKARVLMLRYTIPRQIKILSAIESMSAMVEKDVEETMGDLNDEFLRARRDFQVLGFLILATLALVISGVLYRLLHGHSTLKGLLANRDTQYRKIVDTVHDGLVTMDQNGVISSFNRAAEKIFSYNADEVVGASLNMLIDRDDHAVVAAYVSDVNAEKYADGIEVTGRRCTMDKIYLHLSLSDTGLDGEKRISAVIRDVTVEKARYDKLLQYRDIFSGSDDALAFVDMNHVYRFVNEKYLQLFKREYDDVIGLTMAEVMGEELFYAFETIYRKCLLRDGAVTTRKWVDMPCGRLYLSASYKPYHTGQGEVSGVVVSIRDITEQKKTEDEYFKASKLESIGVLAGGIAHDFNNLLAGISGNIEMALRTYDEKSKAIRYLKTSYRATRRAADLTRQLLTFSKGGEPVKRNVIIADIIRESAEFSLHGSNIQCHFDIPDDLWVVNADAGQIGQVVQNLIINAKNAMPDGGDITICCRNSMELAVGHNDMEGVQQGMQSGRYVKITVEDTGVGIPEEVLDSIFDPYFTTRQEGTGLGLALSYSIINKHHGFIYATSTVGEGTCFTIYLPAAQTQSVAINNENVSSGKVDMSKRIMVMDDDAMIREIAQAMLEDMGYQVIHAENGEQAVEKYNAALQSGEPIDLVIMDLTIMGGMGGREAIEEIQALDPDARAIVSSGYSNDPVMANFTEYGFSGAISKPYSHDELGNAIRESLK